MRRRWLAGSARRQSRPVSRPGNARRNRSGTRRGRLRPVAMAASCLRRPQVPAEEEQPAPPSRRTARQLPEAEMALRRLAEVVLQLRTLVRASLVQGAALSVGGGPTASSAALHDGDTLAALRLRHSSASLVPGFTPVHCAMKSERQEARIAEICSDVGCWAEAASEVPTTSPVAINRRTARQQPNFTQASLFAGRHGKHAGNGGQRRAFGVKGHHDGRNAIDQTPQKGKRQRDHFGFAAKRRRVSGGGDQV